MTAEQVRGPAVHVQGLKKSYKKLQVLRGVDFDVVRGSILALLGSNGAGKTTVVRILSTLLKADFSYVNGRVAQLYGISGVTGDSFVRVALGPSQLALSCRPPQMRYGVLLSAEMR